MLLDLKQSKDLQQKQKDNLIQMRRTSLLLHQVVFLWEEIRGSLLIWRLRRRR